MNNLNGAEEPSMDEILASIRKIIADEAPESALALPPAQAEPALPAATAPKSPGTNPGDAPSSLSVRLNGVFGSTSGAALAVPQRSGAVARTAVDDDLSELFGEPSERPVTVGLPPMPRAAATADQTKRPRPPEFNMLPVQAAVAPVQPAPVGAARPAQAAAPDVVVPSRFQPQPKSLPAVVEPPEPAPVIIAAAPVAPATQARGASPLVTPQGIDFDRVARAAIAPVTQSAATGPVPSPVVQPASAAPSAAPAPEPIVADAEASSGPVVLAAMPAWRPAPAPAPDVAVASKPDAPQATAAPAPPVAAASTAIAAPMAEPETPMTATLAILARAATDAPAQIAPSALAIGLDTSPRTSEPSRAGEDDPAAAAVASALGALAAGLAAAARPAKPEIVVPAIDVSPGADAALVPAAASIQAAPSQNLGLSVFTSPGAFVDGVALEPVGTHALNDTAAAELLRPMLRQWLDSNMPRIVEKALRIELAANPLPLGGEKPKD